MTANNSTRLALYARVSTMNNGQGDRGVCVGCVGGVSVICIDIK